MGQRLTSTEQPESQFLIAHHQQEIGNHGTHALRVAARASRHESVNIDATNNAVVVKIFCSAREEPPKKFLQMAGKLTPIQCCDA